MRVLFQLAPVTVCHHVMHKTLTKGLEGNLPLLTATDDRLRGFGRDPVEVGPLASITRYLAAMDAS